MLLTVHNSKQIFMHMVLVRLAMAGVLRFVNTGGGRSCPASRQVVIKVELILLYQSSTNLVLLASFAQSTCGLSGHGVCPVTQWGMLFLFFENYLSANHRLELVVGNKIQSFLRYTHATKQTPRQSKNVSVEGYTDYKT